MKKVKSSSVDAIGYDAALRQLTVRFKTGAEYRYEGVSPESFTALENAESIGSHLHKMIKGKHPHRKVGK